MARIVREALGLAPRSVAQPRTQYRVKSVGTDHIVCRTWDGLIEGATDVYLARPPLLRRRLSDNRYRNDNLIVHETDTTRTWTDPEGDGIFQRIEPEYVVDSIVYGVSTPLGGTTTQRDTGSALTGSLSVRTGDSEGSVSIATTPTNLVAGDFVSVAWAADDPLPAGRRDGMTVAVADQPVELLGGYGEALPPAGTVVTVTEQVQLTELEDNRGARRWEKYWKGALSMGGNSDTQDNLPNVDMYNPDAWTTIVSLLLGRSGCASFAIGEGVLVTGGVGTGVGLTSHTERFEAGAWSNRTPTNNYPRLRAAGMNLNDRGYLVYGAKPGTPLPLSLVDVSEYFVDTWTDRADAPEPKRGDLPAMVIGTKGYVAGGVATVGSQTAETEEFTPPNTWVEKTPSPAMSPVRLGHGGASIGTVCSVFAGWNSLAGGTYLDDHDEYTPGSDAWASKTDVPGVARQHVAGFALGSEGYVTGGKTAFESPLRVQEVHSWDLSSWTSRASLPITERDGHTCATMLTS